MQKIHTVKGFGIVNKAEVVVFLDDARGCQCPFVLCLHALEKEMATHSSILAWRIPGKGEPGGLLSMGSHRLRGLQETRVALGC